MPRRRWLGLTATLLLATAVGACSSAGGASANVRSTALARELAGAMGPPDTSRLPILFIHGNLGSGDLFETQAQRFTSNGYPTDRIAAFDWDASRPASPREKSFPQLDAEIQHLLAATGMKKIDMVGQSEGAELAQKYLASSPERAARVAHLVSLDGEQIFNAPKGVPMLVVWGGGDPSRRINGAVNIRFLEQERDGLTTSTETFRQMFRFLTGADPLTTDVTPDSARIELAGRALLFPANAPVGDARLEVYRVDPKTGRRAPDGLQALLKIGADGSWGPVRADGTASYEFAIVRTGEPVHHFYYQPFQRSDRLIRLLTSAPDKELGGGMTADAGQTDLVVDRGLEWWGDQGDASDILTVDNTNVITATNMPRAKLANSIYIFDRGSDHASDVATPIPAYFQIGFITGVDLSIPSGDRSLAVALTPRGQTAKRTVLAVPALPSKTDRLTLHFRTDP
ncbi:alpha/beta fold hydrolase [Frankia sp. AgB32]|uniref:alpha/beta fold hydrolase n=1 Tax=Frankia sp. AgB32 TaxID=631119 RepID=UPI00200FD555|nr:alpha/beta fold hydrolase [Frankia sp. AgB32]MCK9896167.1 alpha/beta fold hydrolase [Frankia sp. AgB32]